MGWWLKKVTAFDAASLRAPGGRVLAEPRWKPCGSPRLSKKDTVAKFTNGLVLEVVRGSVRIAARPKEG